MNFYKCQYLILVDVDKNKWDGPFSFLELATMIRGKRITGGSYIRAFDTNKSVDFPEAKTCPIYLEIVQQIGREKKEAKAREKEEARLKKEAKAREIKQARLKQEAMARAEEEERLKKEETALENKAVRETGRSQNAIPNANKQIFVWIGCCLAIPIALAAIGFLFYAGEGNYGGDGSVFANIFSGVTVTKVTIKAGDATITDDEDGISHVKIECNNGLVIDADWERNPYNDFGYDIYEPTVNRSYNRLAVMVIARSVIASYLRGEYN